MTPPSLLILGTDAVLAAAPATPVQLAHACLAGGYAAVVPVSWGDELIARRAMAVLENANTPLVHCACPLVAQRLCGADAGMNGMTVSCAAPPVVTATYLRALSAPAQVRITFAGGCASGAHPSIDSHLTPEELLATLARHGIVPAEQPAEFDAILPPDRRRHFSEPGGLPSTAAMRRLAPDAAVVELSGEDFAIDLAQHLLGSGRVLVDVAAAVGCLCAGAVPGTEPAAARAAVRGLEPPRAPSPVVDHEVELPADVLPPTARVEVAVTADVPGADLRGEAAPMPVATTPTPVPWRVPRAPSPRQPDPEEAVVVAVSRRSPPSTSRVVLGAMPQARSAGRQLPRAYVARRRSSPKGVRQSGVHRQVASEARRRRVMLIWVASAAAAVTGAVLLYLLIAR